jgi:hypothetical protein
MATTAAILLIVGTAAELGHKGYPADALLALLLMPFINTLICDRGVPPSGSRTAASPQPTPEDYMPGGGA